MHLRVAREVESIRITVSSGSVSGLLGVLYAADGRDYKRAGPVPAPSPGPPRSNQSDRQPDPATSPCAVLIGCALLFFFFFFSSREIKRPLKRERS